MFVCEIVKYTYFAWTSFGELTEIINRSKERAKWHCVVDNAEQWLSRPIGVNEFKAGLNFYMPNAHFQLILSEKMCFFHLFSHKNGWILSKLLGFECVEIANNWPTSFQWTIFICSFSFVKEFFSPSQNFVENIERAKINVI